MPQNMIFTLEFIERHPEDAARVLEKLPVKDTSDFLKGISVWLAEKVIRLMDSIYASKCLEIIGIKRAVLILEKLPPDISAIYIRRMAEHSRQSILDSLPTEIKKSLSKLLSYREGSAGSFMDPQILVLPDDISVKEALKRIRKDPKHVIYFIYIISREDKLLGFVSLRELMLSDPNALLSKVMQKDITPISAALSRHAILSHPGWQDYHALPVVNKDGTFLGAIGYRTLRMLQVTDADRKQEMPGHTAGTALGEMFGIGLSGLIKGVAAALEHDKE